MTMHHFHRLLMLHALDILLSPGMEQSKAFIQHGSTSVYAHSVAVALTCLAIVHTLHMHVDEHALVRGALLHDYFLYDWHEKDASHRWHGFTHPKKALHNARRDFEIGKTEEDMIASHMFPLTGRPPSHKESWVLCLADKVCSAKETVFRNSGDRRDRKQ